MGVKKMQSLLYITAAQEQVLQHAVLTFGPDKQTDMVIEEMAELTKALLKLRREPEDEGREESVLEEYADVLIMMYQLEFILVDMDVYHTKFHDLIDKKINRLNNRLGPATKVILPDPE